MAAVKGRGEMQPRMAAASVAPPIQGVAALENAAGFGDLAGVLGLACAFAYDGVRAFCFAATGGRCARLEAREPSTKGTENG